MPAMVMAQVRVMVMIGTGKLPKADAGLGWVIMIYRATHTFTCMIVNPCDGK